jgi:hypothetical protein
MPISSTIQRKFRNFCLLVYSRQVKFVLPIENIQEYFKGNNVLPQGYFFQSFDRNEHPGKIADLLNTGEFGIAWTPQKVQKDILDVTITPDSVSVLFYGDKLVGFQSANSIMLWRNKIGCPNWLTIAPEHRGNKLGGLLFMHTMKFFLRENYTKVAFATDPYRIKAIHIFLSYGARPLYDSLCSFIQWWHIKRKLQRLSK